jgi:signal transduction histidine kinase
MYASEHTSILEVEDDGLGIAEEERKKFFNVFTVVAMQKG